MHPVDSLYSLVVWILVKCLLEERFGLLLLKSPVHVSQLALGCREAVLIEAIAFESLVKFVSAGCKFGIDGGLIAAGCHDFKIARMILSAVENRK